MDYLKIAQGVLKLEAASLLNASSKLLEKQLFSLVDIFKNLNEVGGNLIFCGVGKSGHIGIKLAATFTSLGLPSIFLHPVEALHGDLGIVKKYDAICFISKSGTTSEILKLLPFVSLNRSMIIGLLGNIDSPIAKSCGISFDCSVESEACINNQAPTTSSTLALAMGDAIAVVYENFIGLSKEGFLENHPGGILGKSLRMKVNHLMTSYEQCPMVFLNVSLKDVILEMTKFPVGGCAVIGDKNELLGIVVEGDIRRTFIKENMGLDTPISSVMTKNPIVVNVLDQAMKGLILMEEREKQIDILPVVDDDNRFLGFLRLHDLLKEGFSHKSKIES